MTPSKYSLSGSKKVKKRLVKMHFTITLSNSQGPFIGTVDRDLVFSFLEFSSSVYALKFSDEKNISYDL